MEKKPTSIRLSSEARKQLEELSEMTGRSRAVVLEFAIDKYYRIMHNSIQDPDSVQDEERRKRHLSKK